ncbi:MAG: GNAT family N-acetyltransferase [Clostridia bacterium]|nr:GNAT family N-acetyltransferase [Clostridia bacterium]
MMELKKADASAHRRIRRLYKEAFPREERAPYFFLKWRAKQDRADFFSLNAAGEWVGMAYVLRKGDLAYLFYLAIDRQKRGQGFGTQAIEALKKRYQGARFFLALEMLDQGADNYAQRVRRHDFYLHCGLVDLPYRIKEANVVFDIMGTGGKVEPEEYKALVDEWMGFRRRLIDMRIIKD